MLVKTAETKKPHDGIGARSGRSQQPSEQSCKLPERAEETREDVRLWYKGPSIYDVQVHKHDLQVVKIKSCLDPYAEVINVNIIPT